ncbi:thioredoxin family protein [Zavarzinella formosa]|uniref:thioredoxin family protein n=1 Tax=Zavarzinella formosa TaxID=360055 RepID=UPI0002D93B22|nr:thioredoxin family protein [Zavarzinella formosa]
MNLFEKFSAGLPMAEFLAKYGNTAHQSRWKSTFEAVKLTPEQTTLLGKFTREMNVLVLAGAWCGDCSSQCPIFDRFAVAAPVIKIRYLDNADHADVQQALSINGGKRVPVAVFFSEDGFEVSRYGERTLAKYRQMMNDSIGEGCATGIGPDPLLAQVTREWLDEFERVQYLLRLSGRLRQLHGD